jgi:hypothetical protein
LKKTKSPKPIFDIRPPAPASRGVSVIKKWSKYKIQLIIGLVVVIVVGGVAYHIHQNHLANGGGPSSQSQINKTVDEVGQLMLLPTGEQPTLAIVNNAAKYRSVSFFKNAQNGDELLVYAQAREAILYRPSINKIIAVAPLSVSSQTPNSSG